MIKERKIGSQKTESDLSNQDALLHLILSAAGENYNDLFPPLLIFKHNKFYLLNELALKIIFHIYFHRWPQNSRKLSIFKHLNICRNKITYKWICFQQLIFHIYFHHWPRNRRKLFIFYRKLQTVQLYKISHVCHWYHRIMLVLAQSLYLVLE